MKADGVFVKILSIEMKFSGFSPSRVQCVGSEVPIRALNVEYQEL